MIRCSAHQARAEKLRDPVHDRVVPFDLLTERETERHRRVHVRAADRAERVNHHHQRDAVRERDADQSRRAVRNRRAADERQRKRADEFRERGLQLLVRHCFPPFYSGLLK